jgi:uncharacterized membrane protein YphA (DoxX/SURF4 family)
MASGKTVSWIGRVVTGLVALAFVMSGVMKLKGGPQLDEGLGHLGLPRTMATPLAVLEMVCALLYAVPATSVLGAVLLTGYLGGAICTHWRVGDPFVVQVLLGGFVWLGVYLREPRLRALLPLRR